MILIIRIVLEFSDCRLVVISESLVGPFPPGLAEVSILYGLVCGNILNPFIILDKLVSLCEQFFVRTLESKS